MGAYMHSKVCDIVNFVTFAALGYLLRPEAHSSYILVHQGIFLYISSWFFKLQMVVRGVDKRGLKMHRNTPYCTSKWEKWGTDLWRYLSGLAENEVKWIMWCILVRFSYKFQLPIFYFEWLNMLTYLVHLGTWIFTFLVVTSLSSFYFNFSVKSQ